MDWNEQKLKAETKLLEWEHAQKVRDEQYQEGHNKKWNVKLKAFLKEWSTLIISLGAAIATIGGLIWPIYEYFDDQQKKTELEVSETIVQLSEKLI